jgi:MFS family permease
MPSKLNFTSLENFVFVYLSLRFFTEGVEEFLIQPTAWYYITDYLGESNLFLGLTLASYSGAALLFAPFAGILEVKFQAPKGITLFCTFVRFFGNLLYTIPVNGYFPLLGRFISGLGAAADGVLFALVAKCSSEENHGKAFLYLEGLFCFGTICGPTLGSALVFNIDIYGWQINKGIFYFDDR